MPGSWFARVGPPVAPKEVEGLCVGVSMIVLVLGGIVALGVGIWLGLPGDVKATEREVERAIMEDEGGGPSKRVERRFMAVEWLMRRTKESQLRKSREPVRRPFKLSGKDDPPKRRTE